MAKLESVALCLIFISTLILPAIQAFSIMQPLNLPLTALSVSVSTPSNAIADSGQYELLCSNAAGGTSPYTWNITTVNSITPSIATHTNLFTGSPGQTTHCFTQKLGGIADPLNSPEQFSSTVTDSVSAKAKSSYSARYIVNTAMSTPTLTETNTPIAHPNQYITFTANLAGGTKPYTYKFSVYNSVTNAQLASNTASISTFTWKVPSADLGNTIYANVSVADSATAPAVVNSVKSAITAISQITTTTTTVLSTTTSTTTVPTVSSSSITTTSITSIPTTTAATSSTTSTTTQISTISTSSTTSVPTTLSTSTTIQPTSTTIPPTTTIPAATGIVTISGPSNAIADVGQFEQFTAKISNDSARPYSYLFNIVNPSNPSIKIRSATFNSVNSTGTFLFQIAAPPDIIRAAEQANAIVTDSNGTRSTSSYSSNFIINPALSLSITPSSSFILPGQSVTLFANTTGGTPPYYKYKWYTNSSGNPHCTPSNVIPGSANSTLKVAPATSNTYQVGVQDSASSSKFSCSSPYTVTIKATRSPIKHVIIIMQENHAFDNYFGTYPGAEGLNLSTCIPINLTIPNSPCIKPWLTTNAFPDSDFAHNWNSSHYAYDNGLMNGFIAASNIDYAGTAVKEDGNVMSYYNNKTIPYYWDYAEHYTLLDHMFSSTLTYTLPNRWYEIAGQSPLIAFNFSKNSFFKSSTGKTTALGLVYLNQSNNITTLYQEVQNAGISWRYYTGSMDPTTYKQSISDGDAFEFYAPILSQSIAFSPSYISHIAPTVQIISDIDNNNLSAISWVSPPSGLSEHPPQNVQYGMWYVTDIINQVMASKYWNSTLIIVTYDEYGGYYDNVAPPQIDAAGLGFRVPALVISPYSKSDYIDHTFYSTPSTMKFIEWNWGLSPLTARDADANNLLNSLNFSQAPLAPFMIPLNSTQLTIVNQGLVFGLNSTDPDLVLFGNTIVNVSNYDMT